MQQNASASEQLASTAEELSAQSEGLQANVGFFRTNDDGGPKVPALPRQGRPRSASAAILAARRKPAPAKITLDLGPGLGDETDREFEKY